MNNAFLIGMIAEQTEKIHLERLLEEIVHRILALEKRVREC